MDNMAKFEVGIPHRTFFELFVGEHPSDKIYSVQVAEWNDFVERLYDNDSPIRDANDEKVKVRDASDIPAVVNRDLNQSLTNRADHLRVEPTEALAEFLGNKGVEIPGYVYVQPLGFMWESDGYEIENEVTDDIEEIYQDEQEEDIKTNKNKAILAALIATIALLN